MKNKRGFGQTWYFWYFVLKVHSCKLYNNKWLLQHKWHWNFCFHKCSRILEWFDDLIVSLLDDFDPQKVELSKFYDEFLLLKKKCSKYPIYFFLCMLYCTNTKNFLYFLLKTLLKLSVKWVGGIKLFNIPLAACKSILNIYGIHLWCSLFQSTSNSKLL